MLLDNSTAKKKDMQAKKRKSPDLSVHFSVAGLLKYAAPSIGTMIFMAIYQIADGFFVSNFVGSTALAAVNFAFPVYTILGTFGYMIGTGGSAIVSRTNGAGNPELANRLFSLFVYATIAIAAVLTLIGIPLLPHLFTLMGAQGELLTLSVDYGTILMMGLVFDSLEYSFQGLAVASGKPAVSLWTSIAAGVANIGLDFLFVAVLGWGIKGAAIATVVGVACGGLIPLVYFALPNSSLLRLGRFDLNLRALGEALGNGSSEMVSNISISLVTIVFNMQLLALIGENGVAAYGAIAYVSSIFAAIFIGYCVGTAPLMSFQHGAQNTAEMRSLFKKSVCIMAATGVVMLLLSHLLVTPLTNIFVGYDHELQQLTAHAFFIYAMVFLLMGFNMYTSSLFTALSNGVVSAALSFTRTLVFEVGCVMTLPMVFGADGIWFSVLVAEVLATICSSSAIAVLGPRYGIIECKAKAA